MNECWTITLLEEFDVFDIKDYTIFLSEEAARTEFNRVKNIILEFWALHGFGEPEEDTKDRFRINRHMVVIQRQEIGKSINVNYFESERQRIKDWLNKIYPDVTVSYPETVVCCENNDLDKDCHNVEHEKYLQTQEDGEYMADKLCHIRRRY